MPVKHLEVENFKSYSGSQTIGPFKDFTCVVGPNGAGKSNLMDALSFVLGVNQKDLRSSKLQELIFRPPSQKPTDPTKLKASVTLVYADSFDAGSPETRFTREITPKGSSEYKVNKKKVTKENYEAALSDINVLVKARNFLVFQGDVEGIARKTPKQLVDMLENISGSSDFKEEYETLKKAKEDAEAATIFAFNKQKGYRSERKQYKEQKDEAERFDSKLAERASLQTEFYLWQIFHIDNEITEREEATSELKAELAKAEATEAEAEKKLKDVKKISTAARRNQAAVEKNRVTLAGALDKMQPNTIKTLEEVKALTLQVTKDTETLQSLKNDAANHEEVMAELTSDIDNLVSSERKLEEEYQKIKTQGIGLKETLTPEQEAEYEKIREEAGVASAGARIVLAKEVRSLETARAKAAGLTGDLKEIQGRQEDAQRSVEELKVRRNKLSDGLSGTGEELKKAEKDLKEVEKYSKKQGEVRDGIEKEIMEVEGKLREARDDKRRSKEEEKLNAAIEALKRHYPGVQGKLVDLCKPTQRRFNMAVTVAAGSNMDAIVVDTKSTGFECIQYLREQRVGTATFLPLDSLKVPAPYTAERLRALEADGRYRLAADVISCDENVKKAVLYAVGNTVVCDDLDAARELCFGKDGKSDNRVKAVTISGGVISKAGTMTGGLTSDSSKAAGRWDEKEVAALKQRKEKLEAERTKTAKAPKTSTGVSTAAQNNVAQLADELRATVGNLKNREQYTKSDRTFIETKLKEQEALLKASTEQAKKVQKELDEAEKVVTAASTAVEGARAVVKEAEDVILQPFREKTGLTDLRAYDVAVGRAREEFVEKKAQLRQHRAKLEAQLTYEDGRDFVSPVEVLEKRLKASKDKLEEATKKESTVTDKIAGAKAELAQSELELAEVSKTEKSNEKNVKDAQKVFADAQGERMQVSKSMNSEDGELERLRGELHEILQKARVEEVTLPTLKAGRREDADENDEDETTQSSSQNDSQSQGTSQNSAVTDSTHFSQSDDRKVKKDKRAAASIDFSGLKAELKARLNSDRDEKKIRSVFEQKLAKIHADIEAMAPNMKANDAYEATGERLKESGKSFEECKIKAREAVAEFNKVKNLRAKTFNKAFGAIDTALKTIYRDLTKSSKHPLGGNAYLSLDDSDEPYLGGLKYNAMPPMKRFRDMEHLSGGEKTVAALALLFAIHSFKPAPFFVMDEVDAALDNVNVLKVCNYIRQRSGDFQCIVISLKDMFYELSESLIGVCRDVGVGSSKTLSLDLTKYDQIEPEGEGEKRMGEELEAAGKRNRSIVA
ncbi:hypothetical protein TrST_g10115 [Triparma strigata]|uniref:Structural maintenance of chromosomes protein n=1 Tax=Triparma strigata TaxID=1606541 RepID=A0A9W7E3E8_9STRA|nr:hypothetical protein TrST_g10115 [Triparma strigata]